MQVCEYASAAKKPLGEPHGGPSWCRLEANRFSVGCPEDAEVRQEWPGQSL